MTLEVTIAIDPSVVGRNQTAFVAERLVELGGPMVGWQPSFNGAPAKATFKFKNRARLEPFVAGTSAIPRVSQATAPEWVRRTQGSEINNEQERR